MITIIQQLNRFPASISMSSCLLLVVLIGILDHWLGPEVSTAILYFMPIILAASTGRQVFSYLIATLSALVWLISDTSSGQFYSSNWILFWNFIMRWIIFILVATNVHFLKQNAVHFQNLANIDPLTGALNRRGFILKAEEEFNRARRFERFFSVAYIDLDNFKSVNDQLGHKTGDRLLREVATVMQNNLRVTDTVARLGGDEFAVLLPETSQDHAKQAFDKCQKVLIE